MAKKKPKGGSDPEKKDSGNESVDTREYEKWKARASRDKKVREDWERDYQVTRCENYIIGLQQEGDSSMIVLNHIIAAMDSAAPNLFYTNPKFFVRPKPGRQNPVEDRFAAQGEGLLQAIGDQDGNFENAGTFAVLQNFSRCGVLKVVYDPKLEENPEKGNPVYQVDDSGAPIIDQASLQPLIGPDGAPVVDPETGEPIPNPTSMQYLMQRDPATGKPVMEPDLIVSDEIYRYEWVDAKNMLFPDEGPDMHKWTRIGEEVCVPLEDAKADPRFRADLRERLTANVSYAYSERKKKTYNESYPEDDEMFQYFEYYDLKKKRLLMWAEGQDFEEFLRDGPLPEGIEDHPYSVLKGWRPILGPAPCPWPLPFILPWIGPQKEYNIRRNQAMTGGKKAARKVLYEEGTFADPDEAQKVLKSSTDMEAAKINNLDKPPVILAVPNISTDIWKDINYLQTDMRIIFGATGARLADPDSDSATEATFVERAANLKESKLQKDVNNWLSMAGQKMFQLVKATLTLDIWIKLRGFSDQEFNEYVEKVMGIDAVVLKFLPGIKEMFQERFGKEKWTSVTRETLQFEADVTVIPGSGRAPTLDTERREWLKFLDTLARAPQLALSRELLRYTAKGFGDISERMLDELQALAHKMVSINANQAGRNQGGGDGAPPGGPGQTDPLSLIAGAMGGVQ